MGFLVIPSVLLQDAAWLAVILGLGLTAPARMRRPLALLAVYVTLELVGHGVAEQGAALVLGRPL